MVYTSDVTMVGPTLSVSRATDVRLEADARAFHAALADFVRFYQFRDRDRICCHDVSIAQCYALEALVKNGGISLNELAGYLYLDKSTASRVIDALERKGYVIRAEHPKDGRALKLEVTPAGRRLHNRIDSEMIREERALLAEFKPSVRRSMTKLIRKLMRTIEEGVCCRAGSCCQ